MATLHDRDVDDYFRDCVTTDRLDLRSEQERVAADLAYWSERYADAVRAYEEAKLAVEVTEAELEITERAQMELGATEEPDPLDEPAPAKKGKPRALPKVTESMVKAAVHSSARYIEARRGQIAAEVEKERIRGRVRAIGVKAEQLVGLGAHERLELSKDPAYRALSAAGRAMDEARR